VGPATSAETDERHAAGTASRRIRGGCGTEATLLELRGRSIPTGKRRAATASKRRPARRPVPAAGRLPKLRRSGPPRTSNRTLAAQG